MKSYFLGIVVAIGVAVAYVTHNTADITISFFRYQNSVNQGIWEIFLFGAGALIMWVLSLCASIESYMAKKKRIRELNKKIEDLESEKKSLLIALQNVGQPGTAKFAEAEKEQAVQIPEIPSPEKYADEGLEPDQTTLEKKAKIDVEHEKITPEQKRPSLIKGFFASIFKSGGKPEPEADHFGKTDIEVEVENQAKICDQCDQDEAVHQVEIVDETEVCDQAEAIDQIEGMEQAETFDQIEADDQDEACDETEVCDQVEAIDQTEGMEQAETLDQIEAGDQDEAGNEAEAGAEQDRAFEEAETHDEIEVPDQTETHCQVGYDDEIEVDDERAYTDETDEDDERDKYPYENAYKLDIDADTASEDENGSEEKQDREIFPV